MEKRKKRYIVAMNIDYVQLLYVRDFLVLFLSLSCIYICYSSLGSCLLIRSTERINDKNININNKRSTKMFALESEEEQR